MAEIAKDPTTGDVHVATAIGTSNAAARRKPTADYLESLLETSKAYLPDWLHREIHRRALPKAGGRASARARRDAAAAAMGTDVEDEPLMPPVQKGDGLPERIVLVPGFVSTRRNVEKGTMLPLALHGRYTGRTFLLPGHVVWGALRKAANAMGTAVSYEGALAQSHTMRPPVYDLVLQRVGTPEPASERHGARLVKQDAAQQKVWGVVMEPQRVDTQGDYEERDAIERACHQFMADYRLHKANLGHSHERPMMDDEAVLCENYCTPGPATIGGERVPAGTWVQAWHLKSAPLWDAVLKGEMTGFSFGGTGVREPMDDAEIPKTVKRAADAGA